MQYTKEIPIVLRVAIRGIAHTLDYFPPDKVDVATCCVATRVQVRMHGRIRVGMIVSIGKAQVNPDIIQPCLTILDAKPIVGQELFTLLCWASTYYFCGLGDCIHSMLPHAMRIGKHVHQGGWKLRSHAVQQYEKLSTTQQRLVTTMQCQSGYLAEYQTKGQQKRSLASLVNLGVVVSVEQLPAHWQPKCVAVDSSDTTYHLPLHRDQQLHAMQKSLNSEQSKAVDYILQTKGYACHVLYGVTGSGKTEVYIALARRVIQSGKQVLILVPEIGLTPQTLGRFAACFGDEISVIHSALSNSERDRAWEKIRQSRVSLVIGTRSAIWSPLPKLGLIVIDEEHDNSFKQQSGFRYNARDLAIARAKGLDCPVVLGSATPSIRTVHRIESGKFRVVRLTQRAKNQPMPKIQLVDMQNLATDEYLAPASKRAIETCLENKKQVLIFINRRGFAPVLQCQSCAWQAKCDNCDSRLTLHQQPAGLVCHHCGARKSIPTRCPDCAHPHLKSYGSGTQHITRVVAKQFSYARVIRVDRDSIGTKNNMERILQGVHSGMPVILVGTQMLAKGHDFSNLALVVIVEADNGLFSSDYRAPEVTLQLLMQVAGRSGRSNQQGQVLIQTMQPQAAYYQHLIEHDYDGLVQLLLAERKHYHLPPFTSMVLFRAQHTEQSKLHAFMHTATQLLAPIADMTYQHTGDTLSVMGPSPPALGRIHKHWQEQIVLTHPSRMYLHRICRSWQKHIQAISSSPKWWFDIDPYEVL